MWGREHPSSPRGTLALCGPAWSLFYKDTLFLLPFKAQLFQKFKTENKIVSALTQWKHITYQEQVPPCTSVMCALVLRHEVQGEGLASTGSVSGGPYSPSCPGTTSGLACH